MARLDAIMTSGEILSGLAGLRVLVVGDICLDQWCRYEPALSEPSRETGIARTAIVSTERTPGGGGTIANNLVALGVKDVSVLGVIGVDGFGWELLRALQARRIRTDLLLQSPEMATFTYTKLINGETDAEDLPRVDFVNHTPLPGGAEAQLEKLLAEAWADFDVVLVSDQAETRAGGVISPAIRERLCELAAEDKRKVVWVDSRERGELFRNVFLKLNREEAAAAYDRGLTPSQLRALVITKGQDGVELQSPEGTLSLPARSVEAIDVCGAGDSFSAGAATALYMTGSLETAARFGSIVASITVTKQGTGTASPHEVLEAGEGTF
ncbi:MAG TPA: PfkB family carbohydrate kinase [Bryobacteraceae bacterium]|nr:PfkB family carbohydrate kinase [Bryobacteraceae bacterium]